ncbi:MAG TPA: diacylglycerol kinase family protein [Polyangiaceae bacterium]
MLVVKRPPSRLHILINPASGQEEPVLAPVNRRLKDTSIDWEVTVLKPAQEASAVDAALANRPDLLLVYGGDGTVAKVATRMLEVGSSVALAPLQGGTANALAAHLGVPRDLDQALGLLCAGHYEVSAVDVGLARQHAFLLRLSVGFAAELTKNASREQKGSFGIFAYALSTLQAVRDVKVQEYRLTVDGVTTAHSAIACIVANSSGTGLKSPLASHLDESDAQLDALLVPDMSWVARALANAASGAGLMDGAPRRSGVTLRVECDEPMPVQVDGEYVGTTPVDVEVRHAALRLVRCEHDDKS